MLLGHFVEFINATDALIGKDQRPRFNSRLSAFLLGECNRQARRRRRVATHVDTACRQLTGRQQHLTLAPVQVPQRISERDYPALSETQAIYIHSRITDNENMRVGSYRLFLFARGLRRQQGWRSTQQRKQ